MNDLTHVVTLEVSGVTYRRAASHQVSHGLEG